VTEGRGGFIETQSIASLQKKQNTPSPIGVRGNSSKMGRHIGLPLPFYKFFLSPERAFYLSDGCKPIDYKSTTKKAPNWGFFLKVYIDNDYRE
jgi:hypothetical protein